MFSNVLLQSKSPNRLCFNQRYYFILIPSFWSYLLIALMAKDVGRVHSFSLFRWRHISLLLALPPWSSRYEGTNLTLTQTKPCWVYLTFNIMEYYARHMVTSAVTLPQSLSSGFVEQRVLCVFTCNSIFFPSMRFYWHMPQAFLKKNYPVNPLLFISPRHKMHFWQLSISLLKFDINLVLF